MLKPVRTIAPGEPILTLTEAKAHLRVDHDDEDALITALIQAATDHIDGYAGILGRALVSQTWRINLECWPTRRIRLPLAPVSAITSIKYLDLAGSQQTLASANYALLEDALSPYVDWLALATLPSVFSREDVIEVLFVAGYGAASAVPQAIRHAALLLIGHLHENREAVMVGQPVFQVPKAVDALLAPFRSVGS